MKNLGFWGLLATTVLSGQSSQVVLRSVGQFDTDGTVFYSVYLATRTQAVEDVTVSSAVPAGARFLESVDVPRGVRYEGVADNVVAWRIPAIAPDTLVGPFTFRIRLDGTRSEIPASPAAAVSYQRPAPEFVELPASTEALMPLADFGSVTFDRRGTRNAQGENTAVPVGGTGVILFVPADAVNSPMTLTFRRQNVEDGRVPSSASGTWWCGLFEVSIEPRPSSGVTFAKPVTVALPLRRPLTPGLPISLFQSQDGSIWQDSKPGAERNFGFGMSPTPCFTQFGFSTCGGFGLGGAFGFGGFGGGFGAFGVRDSDRVIGAISGSSLSQAGLPASAVQTITDGTSNIIAILIGRR